MIAIARLSVTEQVRRRLIWVLVVLTLLVVAVTSWGFDRLVADAREFLEPELLAEGVSRILVFVMFQFSFVLAMVAASIGAPAISSEIESGQALALFARPLSRTRFLVGRWAGIAAIVIGYAFAAGALELAGVALITGYVPRSPLGAMSYLAGVGLVVMTLAVLLSTRLSAVASGALAIVLFGMNWVLGLMGAFGTFMGTTALADLARVMRYVFPTDGLWRAAADAAGPPPRLGDPFPGIGSAVDPFSGGGPPTVAYLVFVVCWIVGVLALASYSLSRREV